MKFQEICNARWYHYSHTSSTIKSFEPLITHLGTEKAALKRRDDCLDVSLPYPREVDPALYECSVSIEQRDILVMKDWGSGSEWSLFAHLKKMFASDEDAISEITNKIESRRNKIQRDKGLHVSRAKKIAAKECSNEIVAFLKANGYKVICYSNGHEDAGKYSLAIIDPYVVTIKKLTPLSRETE